MKNRKTLYCYGTFGSILRKKGQGEKWTTDICLMLINAETSGVLAAITSYMRRTYSPSSITCPFSVCDLGYNGSATSCQGAIRVVS